MIKLYTDKISDLHAHTIFSDGDLTILESIKKRIDMITGLEEVGISDHFRDIIAKNLWEKYIKDIHACKNIYNNETFKVLLGVEIFASDINLLSEDLSQDIDFLIVENYENYVDIESYVTMVENIRTIFSGPIILAHPDIKNILECIGSEGFSILIEFLKEEGIPLEINVNHGYWFWDGCDPERTLEIDTPEMNTLNEAEAFVSIGTDSHMYEDVLFSNYELALWYVMNL